jgi:C4-dicarboxylate transporter DctM subunit
VAIGAILYPALKESGYGTYYSTGVIAASGALGVIIPPSVTMIVYGTVTGASVGTLFVAGFGAGIVFGLVFMAYTFFYARKRPELVIEESTTWSEKLLALKSGIFTPTEAAAVAAVYAILVALLVYRELDIKGLIQCIIDSAITTVQVMILLAAASVFAWILTAEGITVAISQSIVSLSSNKYMILLLMNFVLLIAGMFLDGASIITIIGPLFFPIAMAVGIDPIHLGIVMIVNTAIGMYTPPFGLNLFVTPSITKQSITTVSKGVLPFILISLISLLLITYIPEISLWLPRQIYGVW